MRLSCVSQAVVFDKFKTTAGLARSDGAVQQVTLPLNRLWVQLLKSEASCNHDHHDHHAIGLNLLNSKAFLMSPPELLFLGHTFLISC